MGRLLESVSNNVRSSSLLGVDCHGDVAHIPGRVLDGNKGDCLHHRKRGARGDEQRNRSSLYVGGYLDVNRQTSSPLIISPEAQLCVPSRLTCDSGPLVVFRNPAKSHVTQAPRLCGVLSDLAGYPRHHDYSLRLMELTITLASRALSPRQESRLPL